MDLNLYCHVAFRRMRSKLAMSYFSYLGLLLLVISCSIYFFTNKLVQTFNEERVILEAKLAIKREFFDYATSSLRGTFYPGVENYTRYAVARLEMLPLPFVAAKPLIPEFGPVINDVTAFRYPIAIPSCPRDSATSASNQRSAFIAVISAPGNAKKRSAIRQTWTNHIQTVLDKGLLTMLRYGFILGQPSGNDFTQTRIEEESKNFGDIIQIEMSDYYRNLPLKVAGLLNWLNKNCANLDFVFKVDDDVYVNMHNLAHFVQSHHDYNRSVFGIGYPDGNIPDRGRALKYQLYTKVNKSTKIRSLSYTE
jgi:hypothetical protein